MLATGEPSTDQATNLDPYNEEALKQFNELNKNIAASLRKYQEELKRQEYEGLSKGIGTWKIKALNQIVGNRTIADTTQFWTKLLQIASLFYLFLLSFVHLFKPTASLNKVIIDFKLKEGGAVLIYTLVPFLHLLSNAWLLTGYAFYKV